MGRPNNIKSILDVQRDLKEETTCFNNIFLDVE